MEPHKYDRRGAGKEGKFVQQLYDLTCQEVGRKLRVATIKEDCSGIDRFDGTKSIDVKARKFRMPPNTCWIEVASAGGSVGTGWAYKSKWIAQLMVYEENKHINNVVFGEYYTDDLVEMMKVKVDFDSKVNYGVPYKLYTRWFDGQHRGTMTIVSYEDLELLKSFVPTEVPKHKWNEVCKIYMLLWQKTSTVKPLDIGTTL